MIARIRRNRARSSGFTLIELIFVVIVIAILVSLLLPAVRTSREASRRMQCANNLKQLGYALHNYHDANSCFPSAMGGTGVGETPLLGNANRLNGLVALLPFIEQQSLWDQISKGGHMDGVQYPPMGPAPWVSEFKPWQQAVPGFLCPSSKNEKTSFGSTNYAFCIGDMTQEIHHPQRLRGAFGCGLFSRFADITDGTSTTIALAEMGTKSDRAVTGQYAVDQPLAMLTNPSLCAQLAKSNQYDKSVKISTHGRGARWSDGAAGYGLVTTILPPNSPSCAARGLEAVDGIYSAGSLHPGGIEIAFVDGSVRYISQKIDCGNTTSKPVTSSDLTDAPFPSPFGAWGALGTAAGADAAKLD